jgi:hypothetical protein
MRLVAIKQVRWQNRAHFFAMAARMMRRILVDSPSSKESGCRAAFFWRAQPRGGGGGTARVHRYREARLAIPQVVAPPRAQRKVTG